MHHAAHSSDLLAYTRAGALAGAVSTIVFTAVHHALISDIWFSLPLMLPAGILCGLCLAWSYRLLFRQRATSVWLAYNAIYVLMLCLLGLVSALVFEPAISMAALLQADGPPGALIARALPMTLLFTLASAAAISLLFARGARRFGAVLLTTAVMVLLLGLNISTLGLVSIPRGSLYLVAEFLGLVVLLAAVFALAFIALLPLPLWRKS